MRAEAMERLEQLLRELRLPTMRTSYEELARQAHLPLTERAAVPVADVGDQLSDLTPREREVLAHVVAGRTYAEIAQELVISEKTVSVHVSNLLRKTGTSSRIELTELVRRGQTGPAPGSDRPR